MNRQSDFGYAVGGIEHRTRAICAQRAKMCLSAHRRDPQARPYYCSDATHFDMAKHWVTEGRSLPREAQS